MAGELANDNRAALQTVLGRDPDHAELYLAHFLGADGATRFLTGLGANPDASAAALLPKAAAANRPIFYDSTGAPRSLAGVMSLLRDRLEAAATGSSLPSLHGDWALAICPMAIRLRSTAPGPRCLRARPNWARAARAIPARPGGTGLSGSRLRCGRGAADRCAGPHLDGRHLARDLRAGRGSSLAGAGSEHVRQAYGRLKAMGL
jgi:hypothetical protein